MRLLTFKKLEDKTYGDGESAYEWLVWLEDDEENSNYEAYTIDNCEMFWNGYMTAKLGDYISDSDILYYFSPKDKIPAVGERWELDDLILERVK